MPTDPGLDRKITAELRWDPRVHGLDIGVSVLNAVVTLTGSVRSPAAKDAAGEITLRIHGVRGVANDLIVEPASGHERTDSQLAQAVLQTLRWNAEIPPDRLQVRVEYSWGSLENEVDWDFQRRSAEAAVRRLIGITGATDHITVSDDRKPAEDARQRIEVAIARVLGDERTRSETVDVHGHTAILHGGVRTWDECQQVDKAALSAPGITQVDNRLAIGLNLVPVGTAGFSGVNRER